MFLHTRSAAFRVRSGRCRPGSFINRLGTMVEPFLAFYLTSVRGILLTATGAMLALFGLGSVVSQFVGGWLADHIGRRATLTGGMLATAVTMIALGYASAIPVIIGVVFLLGVTIDAYRPASQALVADLVVADRPRPRVRAAVLGDQPRLRGRDGGRRDADPRGLRLAVLGRRGHLRDLRRPGVARGAREERVPHADPNPAGSATCCATGWRSARC